MKRFYFRAILDVRKHLSDELADDINNYVEYLEHEKSVLVNEVFKLDKTKSGNRLLKRLGFIFP